MDNPQTPNNSPDWERKTLERLVYSALDEQKSRRRWGIFFKILGFAYLTAVLVTLVDWGTEAAHQERHTALIELTGVIEPKGTANAEKMIESLQSAFKEKNVAGVIVRINSPGGSPVQAGIINDEIRRLRARWPEMSLLEAQLKTGRTHQIRVHLAHLGFPILGDEKYGDFALNRELKRTGLKRMALHAWRMALRHPLTGVPLECIAPLPEGIAGYIAAVDAKNAREFMADNLEQILGKRL